MLNDLAPVVADVGVEMAELPEQRALDLGIAEDPGLDGFVFSGSGMTRKSNRRYCVPVLAVVGLYNASATCCRLSKTQIEDR